MALGYRLLSNWTTCCIYCPSIVYSWTVWVAWSATITLPTLSVHTPLGVCIRSVGKVVSNWPCMLYTLTVLLLRLGTMMCCPALYRQPPGWGSGLYHLQLYQAWLCAWQVKYIYQCFIRHHDDFLGNSNLNYIRQLHVFYWAKSSDFPWHLID